MKRIILISVFAGIALACAFGQTYYYEHTETVDANGVRTKGKGYRMYITFTRNSCYESDKDGHAKKTPFTDYDGTVCAFSSEFVLNFQYKGKQSDWHEFVLDLQTLCEGKSKQMQTIGGMAIGPSEYQGCMCHVNRRIKNRGRYHYYYFNSDYSRMNIKTDASSNTEVLVRVTPTEDRKPTAPTQFY